MPALRRPQLDAWVADWEEEEAARQRAREAAMGGDGWTVVVRNKVRPPRPSEDGYLSHWALGRAGLVLIGEPSANSPLQTPIRRQPRRPPNHPHQPNPGPQARERGRRRRHRQRRRGARGSRGRGGRGRQGPAAL
jgi:hypothetical protein